MAKDVSLMNGFRGVGIIHRGEGVSLKKSTIALIEARFKQDFEKISADIRRNKRQIKELATKQRELKDLRKGLFEILSKIRGYE